MAECSYTFADAGGKQVTLNGKPAIKAAIADGVLDHLMSSKMIAALGAKDAGAKFSFAGQNSGTASKFDLASAEARIAAGEDAEQVRKDTGWFRGSDGKWRYEISDADAKLRPALKSLKSGGYAARKISSVTYLKRDDGTYDVTLNPPSPQQISDFVSLVGVRDGVLRAVLPDDAVRSIKRREGRDDFIGDLEDARRIDVSFDFQGFNALPLDEALDHPALFAAYPGLREVLVQVDPKLGVGGSFSYVYHNDGPTDKVVRIGSGQQLSTLLHEIQHGIQDIEGFATGGSADRDGPLGPENKLKAIETKSKIDQISNAAYDEARMLLSDPSSQEFVKGAIRKWEKILGAASDENPFGVTKEQAVQFELLERNDIYQSLVKRLHKERKLGALTPREVYLRLAGEVEARNTEARQSMSADERRNTPPSATADVADSDVIVMFNGKEMQSAPPPANTKASRGDSSSSIHPEDAEASLRIVRKAYPGVQFSLHDSDASSTVPKDLKSAIRKAGASGDVKGAYHNGEIHLFRSAIPDIKEFEFTAAHESTHFGLSSMLGPELDSVMLHINKSNPAIAERAQALQDKYGYSVARSTEEALADLGGDMVKVNGWKRLVALVRDFLRRHGFVSRWTDNDIVALIQSARDYAKNPNATTVYRGSVFSQGLTAGQNLGKDNGMDDANNVAGKQAPTPAGDVEAGGAEPRYTSRNWREWYELPRFQSDDHSTVLFNHGHGGYIQRVEDRKSGVFDGIFALRDPGMTERGPDVTAFRVPNDKMLSQRDLEYGLDYNTVSTALADVLPRKIEAGSDRFDSVWSAVVEDSSDFEQLGLEEDGSVREDSFMDIFGYDAEDAGDASWFAQKLRGRLAQKLGYQAVEMDDENGTSWYIVPGVESIPLNEPSASAGSDVKFSRAGQPSLGELDARQQQAVDNVFGKPKTLKERAQEFAKDWKKNLIQGVFDQYAPIKDLSSKGYMLARLARGGDSSLEAMLMYGKLSVDSDGVYRVDYDGNGMNGFAQAMAKLDGEHDRFLAWVSANRAEQLASVGLENLMTPQDIAALKSLAKGKNAAGKDRGPLYAQALRDLNSFNDSVLKIAVDSGLIDEATRQMYKDMPYVPFYRLSEDDAVKGPVVSKGLVNQSAWKKLKGGTDKLNEDLMGNLLKKWSHLITASANNRASKEVLDTAARMGAATDMTNDVVAQDINGQPIYRGNTTGLVRYRGEIKRKIPAGQPYVENGKTLISDGTAEISYVGDRYFRVDDPHLMDAIASIGFTPKVWKPMADFKRYLTFGVTVNPAFKIRNLIRDSIQAVGTADLSYNPVQNILMGAKATDMLSKTRAQMLASGGMLRFGSSEGAYSGHVRRLIEKGVDPQYILDDDSKIKALWKHKILPAFEAYQELGDRSENVNRAALYEQLIAKGMSHAEASFWARDMMDFSMQGKWAAVRTLTAVVPFMNARLQGLYKLGRATAQDYKRMGATLAAVSLASIALMLAYQDDDDWKKREDWDRDGNWWFKIGDTAFRIPKPFEVGAVGTIAERSLELMINDEMTGKRFGQRMRDLVMQNLSMNPTPQIVKPMIDLYANKDSFSGRDIETQGMERMRPEDRYTAQTSEVARFLGGLGLPNPAQLMMGRWEGLSPVQVDHLIRGYFSWLGTTTTNVLDRGIRPMMNRGEEPERRLKDTFLVGNFVESLPSGSSRYVTEFYNQAKEIEQMFASYQQALKEGDAEKAEEIRADNADKFAERGRVAAVKRSLSEVSAQMRKIEQDRNLSGEEKRSRLDDLEKRRDAIVRRSG